MSRDTAAPSRGAQRRARYREIAKVLWEERVLNLMRGSDLEEHAPSPVDDDGHAEAHGEAATQVRERDLPRAVRIRHALERLGPAFVKMGQLLATRRDLVAPDLSAELAKLQDDVPTLPWEEMRPRIEAELGAPVEELFATFDREPLAAASIGQVYRATLDDGTPVAVKVQRPGVTETMEIDLEILVEQAHRLEAHTQWGRDFDIGALAREFADVLRSELDYTHEGRALDRFRAAFADTPEVTFPAVYWDHTTSRVLTMDFVDGVPATKLESGDVPGVDRAAVVDTGVKCYMRQIFELGYYHADPHAGNIFALGDGRIAFVDFGRVAAISERNRDATFDMLLAVFSDDPAQATEAVLAMTGMPPHVDVATMEMELGAPARLLPPRADDRRGAGGSDAEAAHAHARAPAAPADRAHRAAHHARHGRRHRAADRPRLPARRLRAADGAQAHPAAVRAREDAQARDELGARLRALLRPPAAPPHARAPARG